MLKKVKWIYQTNTSLVNNWMKPEVFSHWIGAGIKLPPLLSQNKINFWSPKHWVTSEPHALNTSFFNHSALLNLPKELCYTPFNFWTEAIVNRTFDGHILMAFLVIQMLYWQQDPLFKQKKTTWEARWWEETTNR